MLFIIKKVRKSSDLLIPMFDDYAMGFSGCDNLNEVMHGKTWPYRYSSHKQAGNDCFLRRF